MEDLGEGGLQRKCRWDAWRKGGKLFEESWKRMRFLPLSMNLTSCSINFLVKWLVKWNVWLQTGKGQTTFCGIWFIYAWTKHYMVVGRVSWEGGESFSGTQVGLSVEDIKCMMFLEVHIQWNWDREAMVYIPCWSPSQSEAFPFGKCSGGTW